MDSQKPKKALRNLFSRTEPAHSEIDIKESPVITSNSGPDFPVVATTIETVFPVVATSEPVLPIVTNSPAVLDERTDNISETNPTYSFVKIQYNLDLFKAERGTWQEHDYISFINRIDQAQTDAFFLKGRLVSEIKERFYLDNKRGWALFCDETLNMNYTTANQYIRVSQEFDVTSHQRKDFGFEHFKALLPLSKEARNELLTQTPMNLSVKSLREIVSNKLLNSSPTSNPEKNNLTTRNIVDTLQKLKSQLTRLKSLSLSQEEKWQLYGAFQNLSDEMSSISTSFIATSETQTLEA